MAVRTNLSTRPYTNRRLLNFGLGLLVLICGGVIRPLLDQLDSVQVTAKAARLEVETQQQRIRELEKKIPPPVKRDDLKPKEIELLTAASELIEQRVFPWSKLLRDLESNLGSDVRLTQISVALIDSSNIDLLRPGTAPMDVSIIVIGKQLDDVLNMLKSLQMTGRFDHFKPRKQTTVEGTQEIEYEVEMTYTAS